MNKIAHDIYLQTLKLLRTHARNIDDNGNIIDKELEPISDEIKSVMWDLVDAIEKELKDGKA